MASRVKVPAPASPAHRRMSIRVCVVSGVKWDHEPERLGQLHVARGSDVWFALVHFLESCSNRHTSVVVRVQAEERARTPAFHRIARLERVQSHAADPIRVVNRQL